MKKKELLPALALMTLSTSSLAASLPKVEMAFWQNDAYGAYSINHDDFCVDNTFGLIKYALPELKKRGLKAAFGVIASDCKDEHWDVLKQAINDGHEIYNHAWTHVTPNDDNWSNDEQIKHPHQVISQKLNYQPTFYAFTMDQGSDDAVNYLQNMPGYVGTRAINYVNNTGVNFDEDKNDFAVRYDLYTVTGQWSIYEKKKEGKDILNMHADMAARSGGWAYRTAHGVEDTSWNSIPLAIYLDHLDHIQAKVQDNELWVAPVSEVIKYRATRRECAMTQTAIDQHSVKLSFDDSPACKKVASDVTFIVYGKVSQIVQNQKALAPTANTEKQAMFNANPLDGEITVKF
ncbi:polysaccharide deacetylase family protein [Catenovulum sp. SM1970]|uniref:polysaccharide deacetylase family protein n=1 Tax=Marinifaba aquimaris TaxID=2741323 RepID=UPI001573CDAD|nr:polysaccharide deacetylase family protein [Marinifaba aquimaris]NTS75674.1 polysaccharide deacetylase family protein [Marinifaba aquimaris]